MAADGFGRVGAGMDPWALHETATLDLGDRRRDDRCRLLLPQIGDRPSASLPTATGSHAAMTAAYRFFVLIAWRRSRPGLSDDET